MAVQMDSGGNDVKTQFITREGTYRLMTLSEYSRPNRVGYTNNQGSSQVRVSFVTLPDPSGNGDRLCFNYGKELYVYVYKGVKKAADLTKPVDKKMYKGTNPTCHDFNNASITSDSVSLLIGFSTGQIQLIDPIKKELSKLFNEERLIDKTKITCIHWVPGSSNLFLVSHASGQLYVYNEELMCGTTPPNYQPFKQGEGYAIHTCKTKSTRNPLYRWVIGNDGCCINEFAFSPCGANLAVVSQDGFLRVFHYDTMELIGLARSYFGGFLCVCWSPDGRYIVVGGEDDLVTVWSLHERRVVARGQGHRSWVSVVAFDPYTTSYSDTECHEFSGSDDESQQTTNNRKYTAGARNSGDYTTTTSTSASAGSSTNTNANANTACYRLGSVSQDTQLCLWDITEDLLNQPVCTKNRTSTQVVLQHSGSFLQSRNQNTMKNHATSNASNDKLTLTNNTKVMNSVVKDITSNSNSVSPAETTMSSTVNTTVNSLTQRLTNLSFGDKKTSSSSTVENTHKRNFSLGSKSSSSNSDNKNHFSQTVTLRTKHNNSNNSGGGGGISVSVSGSGSGSNNQNSNNCMTTNSSNDMYDPLKLIGTASCPRFDECPVLEPLICKKIAHERLTALVFREDCLVTACQDGYVYTWARPGKMNCNGGTYPRSEPD